MVIVVEDEDVSGIFLGLSGHGSLDLNGTNFYKLVELNLSKTLSKECQFNSQYKCRR